MSAEELKDTQAVEGPIVITVRLCARCDQTHENLEFKRFTKPPPLFGAWAPCPTTGEPILLSRVAAR